MKSPVNYLGSRIERQKQFRFALQAKLSELDKLTAQLKKTLLTVLPNEAIQNLRVIHCDGKQLIISTDNHTVANHLNYMKQSILDLLHHEHLMFDNIQQLKFRVSLLGQQFQPSVSISPSLQRNQTVNTVTSCEISESTRQNITHLAELVTNNERLAIALHKLAQAKKS